MMAANLPQTLGGLEAYWTEREEIFWSLSEPNADGCWIWQRRPAVDGYGRFAFGGKLILTHRLSWTLTHGEPPPPGMCVCHRCDVRLCVNPDHLFIGTHADNTRDMYAKGRNRPGVHAKLSPTDVRSIRSRLAEGERPRDLAPEFGVAVPTVNDILHGRTWGNVA